MDGSGFLPATDLIEAQDDDFLAEVRVFLDVALTAELREASRVTLGVHSDLAMCRIWQRRLYDRGWAAPAWPAAWGGTGWSARQRFLFDRECARAGAPVLFAGGLRNVGPLLIEMGSPEQQTKYLPGMLTGDDIWCQGFSEPCAGSDLAALQCRAVRDGDHYMITGSKIWTTGAHHANRMYGIFRTSDGPKKQNGMTFLLIDMPVEGMIIRPIIALSGEHEFNEVFFDGVRVPVANRVGEEGDGWTVAKRAMGFARSSNTPAAIVRRVFERARTAMRAAGDEIEPGLRRRLAELAIELETFETLEAQTWAAAARPVAGDSLTPSMLKMMGSELHGKVAELAMQISAPGVGGGYDAIGAVEPRVDDEARAIAKHIATRAATVYSGSSETQRNVLAQGLLGRI